MNKIAALAASIVLAACAGGAARSNTAADALHVDDAEDGQALDQIAYDGKWEHVAGVHDGRYQGTSSRSRRAGDSLTLTFIGDSIRVYGVLGPNGGEATIAIDGSYYGTASFFASSKQVHVPVFESPKLGEKAHTLGMVVIGAAAGSHHGYVNIDEIEVLRTR